MFLRLFAKTLLFCVLVVSVFCFWTIFWLHQHFGTLSLEQLLFHMHFPLLNVGNTWIKDFFLLAFLPAALVVFLLFYADNILNFLNKIAFPFPLARRFFYAVLASIILLFFRLYVYFSPLTVLLVFFAAMFAQEIGQWRFFKTLHFAAILFAIFYCSFWTEFYLQIRQFVENYKNTSNFYETHYVNFTPPPLGLKNAEKPNLVVIFSESMIFEYDEIPRLKALAHNNFSFYSDDNQSGVLQPIETWTVAAYVSYLCAIPLNIPFLKMTAPPGDFLKNTTCVTDILKKRGYAQYFISGVDSTFAGQKKFFNTHGVEMLDLPYFQSVGKIPKTKDELLNVSINSNVRGFQLPSDLSGVSNWGINDKTLFALAKETFSALEKKAQPFVLFLATMDTHGENFSSNKNNSCPDLPHSYSGFLQCADRLIVDFVESLPRSTRVIILGDHTPWKANNKPIYNAFLHTGFEKMTNAQVLKKNRRLTHFDIAPLFLESVGIPAESFGLGRNPLHTKTLLESDFTLESLGDELKRRNVRYESFWDAH